MARSRRARNSSANTQEPLSQTIIPSVNIIRNQGVDNEEKTSNSDKNSGNDEDSSTKTEILPEWVTSNDLLRKDLPFTQDDMYSLNNFLLGNPNMTSSHLFRADILFDSAGELKTPKEKEKMHCGIGTIPQDAPKAVVGGEPSISSSSPNAQAPAMEVSDDKVEAEPAPHIPGFVLKRTVVRKLIPRNPRVDKPLNQTCHYYEGTIFSSPSHPSDPKETNNTTVERTLYLSLPHIKSVEDVPFYHPHIRGLAFLYDFQRTSSSTSTEKQSDIQQHQDQKGNDEEQINSPPSPGNGTLSLHILPFPPTEGFEVFPNRLERTLQNLLSTQIRLAQNGIRIMETETRQSSHASDSISTISKNNADDSYNRDKDNIIPRHMVQNTYARLKLTYSRDLCQRWVESTDPSKHVFEDLLITAFLIELWRNMYGVSPKAESESEEEQEKRRSGGSSLQGEQDDGNAKNCSFPGFVDMACGNGVLVYVLLMEGYQGWGFDARQRKTWTIFPEWVQSNLKESIYIPKPFVDEFISTATAAGEEREETEEKGTSNNNPLDQFVNENGDILYNTADFPRNTFVISNHADELTVWTPLLSALACPEDPLPFLSIPCCSHSLSGARYRYPAPKKIKKSSSTTTITEKTPISDDGNSHKTGDLRALRAEKQAASTSHPGNDLNSTAVLNSMYGSLTAKTMSVAEEVGYGVEKTMLRIPSTRNLGVIGGRLDAIRKRQGNITGQPNRHQRQKQIDADSVRRIIDEVVERECVKEGGVHLAARMWIERAAKLQKGKNP